MCECMDAKEEISEILSLPPGKGGAAPHRKTCVWIKTVVSVESEGAEIKAWLGYSEF